MTEFRHFHPGNAEAGWKFEPGLKFQSWTIGLVATYKPFGGVRLLKLEMKALSWIPKLFLRGNFLETLNKFWRNSFNAKINL